MTDAGAVEPVVPPQEVTLEELAARLEVLEEKSGIVPPLSPQQEEGRRPLGGSAGQPADVEALRDELPHPLSGPE